MATTIAPPKTLSVSLDQALKLRSAVEAGSFNMVTTEAAPGGMGTSITKKSSRSHAAFVHDLKMSVQGDGALRELLLDKKKVQAVGRQTYAKALAIQHRAVWAQKAARLSQSSAGLYEEVIGMVRHLWAIRKSCSYLGNPAVEAGEHVDVGVGGDVADFKTADEVLFDLARRQMEMEDEASNIATTLGNLGLCRDNRHEFKDQLKAVINDLRREEAAIESGLPWLRKNHMKSYETAANHFAICSALSPSKMIKIKKSAGSKKSNVYDNDDLSDEAVSDISSSNNHTTASSEDSAPSSTTKNSILAIQDQSRKVSIDSGVHVESKDNEKDEIIPEKFKKQALERHCERCQRKMSVKFDFDKMETEGDPEAWVLFNCSMCSTPVNPGQDDQYAVDDDEDSSSSSVMSDPITDQFSAILQDITVYYTKKLDMFRIKLEHHYRNRPDQGHYELALALITTYEDHCNKEELWKDMFCQLVGGEATPLHATSIHRWMVDEAQIKAAMRACVSDLRRERDKVISSMDKLKLKARNEKLKLKGHKTMVKDQMERCQALHKSLQVLRQSKNQRLRQEKKAKEEEDKRREMERLKKEAKFRERQREQWAQIRSHRRNQEEIKAERRFQLHQELKDTVQRRREKALQDFIRINLRKVMAEQKVLERKAAIAAKEMEVR